VNAIAQRNTLWHMFKNYTDAKHKFCVIKLTYNWFVRLTLQNITSLNKSYEVHLKHITHLQELDKNYIYGRKKMRNKEF